MCDDFPAVGGSFTGRDVAGDVWDDSEVVSNPDNAEWATVSLMTLDCAKCKFSVLPMGKHERLNTSQRANDTKCV